jgi:hypothetical protein
VASACTETAVRIQSPTIEDFVMANENSLLHSIVSGLLGRGMVYHDRASGTIFTLRYSCMHGVKRACLDVLRTQEGDCVAPFNTYARVIAGPGMQVRSSLAVVRDMVVEALQNFDLLSV